MTAKSQKFQLYDDPAQMEPLLPGEHQLAPLLEQAHDLQKEARSLAGQGSPADLPAGRHLSRLQGFMPTGREAPAATRRRKA